MPLDLVSKDALETAACVCGEEKTGGAPLRSKDEQTGKPFQYVRCALCGIERCSPRPVAEAIGGYYPEGYSAHVVRKESLTTRLKRLIYNVFWADEDRVGALRPLLRVVLYPLRGRTVLAFRAPRNRRIFEFGAATGNDLADFRDLGWEISGCEPSPHACAMAAKRGIRLQNCTAEEAVLAPGSVSCILLNHVFEHVHDPVTVLKTCHQALERDGTLVIVVPNHASWSAGMFGAAWSGYDAPRHLWGFSPETLAALLARHGFKVEEIAHRAPGRWAWLSALDGRHAADPAPAWRVRQARLLARLLLPVGVLGALLGRGDFIKVIARRMDA